MQNKAVFLDRDGTVIEDVKYLKNLADLELISGSAKAIRLLNESPFKVILVTNQSGVARGFFDEQFVNKTHVVLQEKLEEDNAHFDGIYYCPHHPDEGSSEYKRDCDCRKPGSAMFKQAAIDYDLDLTASFSIGDKKADIIAGKKAGCRNILVLTGNGSKVKENIDSADQPDFIANNILAAAEWILRNEK